MSILWFCQLAVSCQHFSFDETLIEILMLFFGCLMWYVWEPWQICEPNVKRWSFKWIELNFQGNRSKWWRVILSQSWKNDLKTGCFGSFEEFQDSSPLTFKICMYIHTLHRNRPCNDWITFQEKLKFKPFFCLERCATRHFQYHHLNIHHDKPRHNTTQSA